MVQETENLIMPDTDKNDIGSFIYKSIYFLGIQTIRYIKRFCKRFYRLIIRPIGHFFVAVAMFIYTLIAHLIDRYASAFVKEGKYFKEEVSSARSYMSRAIKKSSASTFYIVIHYLKKVFAHHKSFLIKTAYILMPVVSFMILLTTILFWNNVTFALEVSSNGKNLGYISDESVYIEAYKTAKDIMEQDDSEASQELSIAPSYNLKIVPVNKLSNSDMLLNSIIENSDDNFVNACGIYVNDNFLCSVVNEIDARTVFENIIKANSVNIEENTTVDFYDDIKFVQSFYLKDSDKMWDASTLSKRITCSKTSNSFYTVSENDTALTIAESHNLSVEELANINPGIDVNNLSKGQTLLVDKNVTYLRLKTIKTIYLEEKIPYETEETKTSSLFKGSKQVTRKGVNGVEEITIMETYVEGVKISSEEVERNVISEPVNAKVLVGTRTTSVATGTYNLPKLESGFVWPVIGAYDISNGYGYYAWRGKVHRGTDITGAGANGKTIVAAAAGTVTQAGLAAYGYGYSVTIDHGSGIQTRYAHCQAGSISVHEGQHVSQGQAIAKVGATGNATGPHLHFEVIVNGERVDPKYYLGY